MCLLHANKYTWVSVFSVYETIVTVLYNIVFSFKCSEDDYFPTCPHVSQRFSVLTPLGKAFSGKKIPLLSSRLKSANPQWTFIMWDQLTVCVWMEACFSKQITSICSFQVRGQIKMSLKSQLLMLKQCFFWGRAKTTKCDGGTRTTWASQGDDAYRGSSNNKLLAAVNMAECEAHMSDVFFLFF